MNALINPMSIEEIETLPTMKTPNYDVLKNCFLSNF
jgi:hypothetical protein